MLFVLTPGVSHYGVVYSGSVNKLFWLNCLKVELEESAAKLPSLQTALDNAYKYVSFNAWSYFSMLGDIY